MTECSFDDMCEMSNMKEETIFENLAKRYKKDQIYTFIGPTLLVLNPYRVIPELYNQQIIQRIVNDAIMGSMKGYPHIYTIAANAFRGLKNKDYHQSIIISGESGAGKTESTKYCMQILAQLSQEKQTALIATMKNKLSACDSLLEAFGNSKTIRNDNSSRFGKYVQLLFGKDFTIKGAKIQSYLLEKSRVVMTGVNERNFHIFYALTTKGIFGAKEAPNYAYLNRSKCFTAENIDDSAVAKKVFDSLEIIGFDRAERQKIRRLLIAIIELGNINFDDEDFQKNQHNTCKIPNRSQFPMLLYLLQATEEELLNLLLKKQRGDVQINTNKLECQSKRDNLSKAIYNAIFQFIIDKINIALSPHNQQGVKEKSSNVDGQHNSFSQISLLDIYGFQNFDKNSIQQICINFANQKLLQQYNHKVFENQMILLEEDQLKNKIQSINKPSNIELIDIINQIFNLINDNTIRPAFKESDIIHSINYKFTKHKKVNCDTKKQIFKVKHSHCLVSYSTEGFKTKNQDQLTPQINKICTRLFPNTTFLQKKTNKTILKKYTEDIDGLISKLSNSTNHFVRCIKPNEKKQIRSIDQDYMTTQIKFLGVFETIKIRQAIFPSRKTHEDFKRDYLQIYPQAKGSKLGQVTEIILKKMNAKQGSYLLGKKRVYLNKELDEKMQKILEGFVQIKKQKATIIQRRYRASHARKLFKQTVANIIKRIRVTKFSETNEKILIKLTRDRCSAGFRQVKKISEKKKIKLQEKIINQKPETKDTKGIDQAAEAPVIANHQQSISNQNEKINHVSHNEECILKLKIDKYALLQERKQLEEQKKMFQVQKKENILNQISYILKQKDATIFFLQNKILEIEQEKNQQQISISKKIQQSEEEKERQHQFQRILATKYIQLVKNNLILQKKLEKKDNQLKQLIKARANQKEASLKFEEQFKQTNQQFLHNMNEYTNNGKKLQDRINILQNELDYFNKLCIDLNKKNKVLEQKILESSIQKKTLQEQARLNFMSFYWNKLMSSLTTKIND